MDELKAVKLAIRMETKAFLFYKEAARHTKDPRAKKILGKFSQDERKHALMLQTLVDDYYIKNSRFDIPDMTVTEYAVNKQGPIFSKGMVDLADHPEPVVAAVKKFALAEGEAIKLYKKLSGASKDPALGRFFRKLAAWEERHLQLLKMQADNFKKARQGIGS
jgi:rubrerythrin